MLKKVLKKILSKLGKTQKSNAPHLIPLETGGHNFKYQNFLIFTHDPQCINGAQKQIFKDEIYHFETNEKEPLIIDAGANIGLGIIYWKNLYPDAKIIAFEPSKEVFKSLNKNVTDNKLTNVELHHKAVSDYNGIAKFTTNEKISGSLILEKNLDTTYDVEVVKLSDYIKNNVIDFLKIDIEGEEKKVFFEILPYLKNVKNLFIEYHSFVHDEQYLSKILHHLELLNFRYYLEDDFKVKKPLTSNYVSLNQDMKINLWAKPKSSV